MWLKMTNLGTCTASRKQQTGNFIQACLRLMQRMVSFCERATHDLQAQNLHKKTDIAPVGHSKKKSAACSAAREARSLFNHRIWTQNMDNTPSRNRPNPVLKHTSFSRCCHEIRIETDAKFAGSIVKYLQVGGEEEELREAFDLLQRVRIITVH